ncbi:hypothetical protein [Novosphingobium kaempferiae]|uniref:hypothetical protein n=1 Tax=Novosphingobium kaempferiae TaxID=2896849 RepID=UPI001E2F4374|nr:hypothetical protein [Novosphingobium kaempferiae]
MQSFYEIEKIALIAIRRDPACGRMMSLIAGAANPLIRLRRWSGWGLQREFEIVALPAIPACAGMTSGEFPLYIDQ